MASYKVLFLVSFCSFAQQGYCALHVLVSLAVGNGTGRGTCLSRNIIDIANQSPNTTNYYR